MTIRRRDFIKNAVIGAGLVGTTEAATTKAVGKRRRAGKVFKIDSYCHFSPPEIFDKLGQLNAPPSPNSQRAINQAIIAQQAITQAIKALWDVDDRLKVMDETGVDMSIFIPQPF